MKGLTKPEAAKFLGISVKTLNDWLWKRRGPPSTKYLNRVYFDPKDLEAFKRSITERRAS